MGLFAGLVGGEGDRGENTGEGGWVGEGNFHPLYSLVPVLWQLLEVSLNEHQPGLIVRHGKGMRVSLVTSQ